MVKYLNRTLKICIKAFLTLIGGIFLFVLFWFAYLGVTILLETTIYHDNPQELGQDTLRSILALLVGVLTLLLMRTKLNETIKGMLLLAGLAAFLTALVLLLYMIMWLAVSLVVLVSAIVIWILIKNANLGFIFMQWD